MTRIDTNNVVPLPRPQSWICANCGCHHPRSAAPPPVCAACADERAWVPPTGQRWTTDRALREAGYRSVVRDLEPGLTGFGVDPPFGAGQRGLLVQTARGNLFWDPPAYLDDEALRELERRGGVDLLGASTPRLFGALLGCRERFGARACLSEPAAAWLDAPGHEARPWTDATRPLPGVTLVECGIGSTGDTVAHWADGADGAGSVLTGDTVLVTPGTDRVTFAWSAANLTPMPERGVRAIVRALRPFPFDRIYGRCWSPVLRHGGRQILETSARRYIQFLRGDVRL